MEFLEARGKNVKFISANDQRVLLLKYRKGEEAAGEKLLLSNTGYIMSQVNLFAKKAKIGRKDYAFSDLTVEAYLGFYHGMRKYDFEKSSNILSYCSLWIYAYIVRYLKQRTADDQQFISILRGIKYEALYSDHYAADAFLDLFTHKEQIQLVEQAFDYLAPKEQAIIRARYLSTDEPSLTTVGVRMNLVRERIRQIENIALDRLREVFGELREKEKV